MTDIRRNPPPSPAGPAPAGNMSTGWLKLIALFSMFIDHSGKVLFNNMVEMRTLGRIAFPLYVWCMIVGFYRTRDVSKYLIRILLVGLISQPLYLLALDYQGHVGVLIEETVRPLADGFSFPGLRSVLYTVFMAKPNIFLTLLMGLIALAAIREKHWLRKARIPICFLLLMAVQAMMHDGTIDKILQKITAPWTGGFSFSALVETLYILLIKTPNYFCLIVLGAGLLWTLTRKGRRPGQVWGPSAMILLATVLRADYGWKAIVFFILLYAARESLSGLAAVIVSYCLFWGSFFSVTASMFETKINLALLPDSIAGPVKSLLRSETYALMGLPLILIRFQGDIRLPKWLGYLLYPAHLVLLIILKTILFGWYA